MTLVWALRLTAAAAGAVVLIGAWQVIRMDYPRAHEPEDVEPS